MPIFMETANGMMISRALKKEMVKYVIFKFQRDKRMRRRAKKLIN